MLTTTFSTESLTVQNPMADMCVYAPRTANPASDAIYVSEQSQAKNQVPGPLRKLTSYVEWVREKALVLVLGHPRLVTAVAFMLFFTVSNQIYYVLQAYFLRSSFWHMIVMGVLMGFFASIPILDLVHRQRQLAQVELVRAVVTTLHHEINNPLTVILGSAMLMRDAHEPGKFCLESILDGGNRIKEVMAKLDNLNKLVALRTDAGFEGAIDLDRSA